MEKIKPEVIGYTRVFFSGPGYPMSKEKMIKVSRKRVPHGIVKHVGDKPVFRPVYK